MIHEKVVTRWLLAGLACSGAFLAPAASALIMQVQADYTNRLTGATGRDFDGHFEGTITASVAAPTVAGYGPASATALSSDTGTFWASAQAGGLDPFLMESYALWDEDGVRTTESSIVADITGATLEVIDFGSFLTMDLFAAYSFEAFLGSTRVYFNDVIISGRGGFDGGDFTVNPDSTARTTTIQPSGYVSGVRHTLDPFSLSIDLSGIGIGDPYSIRYIATARAGNAGGETFASAWFRDPVTGTGGISVRRVEGEPVAVSEPTPFVLLGAAFIALLRLRGRKWQWR